MTKGKRRLLKIGAALLGLTLIAFLVSLASSFLGNPVSQYFAGQAIRAHVAETYPDLELELGDVRYNFKFSEYYAVVSSPTSKDTHFTVSWRGNDCYDDYESAVTGGWNTLTRLGEECTAEISPLLSKIPGLKADGSVRVELAKEEWDRVAYPLDTPYEKNMPIRLELCLRVTSETPSLEAAARLLEQTHQILKTNGYLFEDYEAYLQNPEVDENYIMIGDVTPEMIESGGLLNLFLKYENRDSRPEGTPSVSVWPRED